MKRPTIYLANPWGFTKETTSKSLDRMFITLEKHGFEVWEPFARNNQVDFANPDWAYQVGLADVHDVRMADAFFGVVNMNPPDEGVCVELGIAIEAGKPIWLFRDDFRKCTDSGKYPLNLMLFTGWPKDGWEKYYFTTFEQVEKSNSIREWIQGWHKAQQ